MLRVSYFPCAPKSIATLTQSCLRPVLFFHRTRYVQYPNEKRVLRKDKNKTVVGKSWVVRNSWSVRWIYNVFFCSVIMTRAHYPLIFSLSSHYYRQLCSRSEHGRIRRRGLQLAKCMSWGGNVLLQGNERTRPPRSHRIRTVYFRYGWQGSQDIYRWAVLRLSPKTGY